MIVIPQELKMQNFMGIKQAHLFFENKEKLIFITGENGEGKTTVLEALNICLSGGKREQANYEDYVRRHCTSANLKFKGLVDDTPIFVTVTLTSKGRDIEVVYGGRTEVNTSADELLEELGLKKFCRYSFYMQDTHDILKMPPAELSEHIRGVLSVDTETLVKKAETKQEEAEALLQKAIAEESNKKGVIQGLEVSIKDIEALLEQSDFNAINALIEEKQKQIINIDNDIKIQDDEILDIEKQINYEENTLQDIQNALNVLSENERNFFTEKNTLQTETNGYTLKLTEIGQIEKQQISLEGQKEEYLKAIKEIEESLKVKKEQLEQEENILHIKKGELENQEATLNKYNAVLSSLNTKQDILLDSIEKLGEGICPLCGKECSHNELQKLEEEKSGIEQRIAKGNTCILEETEKLNKIKEEIKNTELRIYDLKSHITRDETSIDNNKKELLKIDRKYEELSSYNKENIISFTQETLSKLEDNKERISIIDIKIKKISDDRIIYNEKNEKTKKCQQELKEAKKDIQAKKGELREQKENIQSFVYTEKEKLNVLIAKKESIETNKKALVEAKKQLVEAEKQVAILTDKKALWKKIRTKTLKDFQTYINLKAVSFIEEQLNSITQELFDYIRIKLVPKGKGLQIRFTDERDNKGLSENEIKWTSGIMASRMQNQTINIAFLILFQKLYNNNLLLMDESDSHASYEKSKLLFNYFGKCEDLSYVFAISQKIRRVENEKVIDMPLNYKKSLFKAENGTILEIA